MTGLPVEEHSIFSNAGYVITAPPCLIGARRRDTPPYHSCIQATHFTVLHNQILSWITNLFPIPQPPMIRDEANNYYSPSPPVNNYHLTKKARNLAKPCRNRKKSLPHWSYPTTKCAGKPPLPFDGRQHRIVTFSPLCWHQLTHRITSDANRWKPLFIIIWYNYHNFISNLFNFHPHTDILYL